MNENPTPSEQTAGQTAPENIGTAVPAVTEESSAVEYLATEEPRAAEPAPVPAEPAPVADAAPADPPPPPTPPATPSRVHTVLTALRAVGA